MKILKCTFLVLAMALCLFVPVQRGYAADQETTQVTEQSEQSEESGAKDSSDTSTSDTVVFNAYFLVLLAAIFGSLVAIGLWNMFGR